MPALEEKDYRGALAIVDTVGTFGVIAVSMLLDKTLTMMDAILLQWGMVMAWYFKK